jgi:hypothetical protein
MRPIFLGVLLLACVRVEAPRHDEVIVSVQSHLDRDVCAVRLWSDAVATDRALNRLLPDEDMVSRDSPFRLHAGERRDFVLPPSGPLHLEAVGCDGQLLARREVDPKRATLTLAAR